MHSCSCKVDPWSHKILVPSISFWFRSPWKISQRLGNLWYDIDIRSQVSYGKRLIHHISTWHIWSHEAHPHVELIVVHFTFCFVKALRWGVTRFAQPHVHTCMFCPYVISNLYQLLEEIKMRTFKRYFPCTILLSHNFTPKRKWIKILLLFITIVFHRALASILAWCPQSSFVVT